VKSNLTFDSFPSYAAEKRNELAHGRNRETYQGSLFHINFFIAQLLLGVCILHSLGVTKINKKISHYDKWNRNLHNVLLYKSEAEEKRSDPLQT
jgi:hypothetical protein